MLVYDIISAVIIAILTGILVAVIITLFAKGRSERIRFIRTFKKGKCALIYIAAIPIYLMGIYFAGGEFFPSLFNAISQSVILVVLRYEIVEVAALMAESLLFSVATYFCFALVALNAVLFSVSLFHEWAWRRLVRSHWIKKTAEKVMVIGYNPESLSIYWSVKGDRPESETKKRKSSYKKREKGENKSEKKRTVRPPKKKGEPKKKVDRIIVDNLTPELATSLFIDGVHFISSDDVAFEACELIEHKKLDENVKATVVVNTGDDERNLEICRTLQAALAKEVGAVSEEEKTKYITELFSSINIYVFGSPTFEALYEKVSTSAFGCIHYVNKYKQIATDFIDKHPISAYIPKEYINEDTTVKESLDINVALVGFGKTNQQIFLTSVANNQFLTRNEDGKVVLKQINYTIFDKDPTENNKNLNHNYNRFKQEIIDKDRSGYLEIPDEPAHTDFTHFDINDPEFYKRIQSMCQKRDSVTAVIIAFGDDLENIDLAEKLLEKKGEWGATSLKIFVKVRSGNARFDVFKSEDCFLIGCEDEVAYSLDRITNDRITKMAMARNLLYAIESDYKKVIIDGEGKLRSDEELVKAASFKWFVSMTQLERESNVYAALSLRSKLHLIGLDYKLDGGVGLDEKVFDERYDTKERKKNGNHEVKGKPLYLPTFEFTKTRRGMLALQEHYRWNSYMITHGIVPADINTILNERVESNGEIRFSNGKNYAYRRHGNITTADGLVRFRRIVAERDGVNELDKDVIRYDYQLMDDAFWLINHHGYTLCEHVFPEANATKGEEN